MDRVALVYPYNRQFTPFLRYNGISEKFNEIRLVSPAGWGIADNDASRADGGCCLGIKVSSDFQSQLDNCDTVIFCDYSMTLDFRKIIYPKILESIHKNKDIVCLLPLDPDLEKELRILCNYEHVKFNYYNNNAKSFIAANSSEENLTIKAINTPMILVMGVGERTGKFDIQLALRDYYSKRGYKVSQIGTRNYCEWLGFHSFPCFMSDKTMSEMEKVVYLNNYIKSIERKESPDVFIIGVPGGIMPVNDIFVQDFGILAYQYSCAVKPDVCILSLYYDRYEAGVVSELNNLTNYRFGFEIDCLNVANAKMDLKSSIQNMILNYLTISNENTEEIKKGINSENKPVFNISNGQDAKAICEYTEGLLEKYSEISLVNEI